LLPLGGQLVLGVVDRRAKVGGTKIGGTRQEEGPVYGQSRFQGIMEFGWDVCGVF